MKNLTAYLFASILLSPAACMAMTRSSSDDKPYDSEYYSWSSDALADLAKKAKDLNKSWKGAAEAADSEKTELEKFGHAADAAHTDAGAAANALNDAKEGLREAQAEEPHMPEKPDTKKGCCRACCTIQ